MQFGTGKRLTRRTSMLSLAGAAAAVLAACGEVEVRYVQGPAGPAGPAGQQGERGAAGSAGAKGAAGAAGQTIVVEKEKAVVVEKIVEVPAPAKPTQILRAWTVWWGWNGPGANGERALPMKELVDMWNERGTNTPVILEPPPPTTEAMRQAGSQGGIWEAKIIAATAAGQQPDFVDPNLHQSHEFGDVGISVDLAPMVKQDKEYAATLDDFFPYLLETSYWKGKLWSLPQTSDADLPYTNLDHVQQAGLQPLEQGYTWDDLVEYCQALQTFHGAGEETNKWAFGHAYNWVNLWNLLKQNGGDVYNEDYTKVTLNSPEGIETIQWMMDLVHTHKIHTPHPDWFEARGLPRPSFRKGQITLFYETSARRVITWAQDIGGLDKMYVSPPPTKKQAFTIAFGRQFTQFRTEPAREEAGWGFLRWLTSTDGLAHYSAGTMFMPARKSILTHPKWLAVMKIAPQYQTFLDQQEFGFRPFHPTLNKASRPYNAAMQETWKNPNAAPKTLFDEAARQMTVLLEDFRARGG